jgi:hypothetical protein
LHHNEACDERIFRWEKVNDINIHVHTSCDVDDDENMIKRNKDEEKKGGGWIFSFH